MKIDLDNGKFEFLLTVIICAIVLTTFAVIEFNRSLEVIAAENECIAELIQLGEHRKDIIAKDGECYVTDSRRL